MFEYFSLEALQLYWWSIVSLLGGLFVFIMFIQGGQSLLYRLGKTEIEKSIIINSLGRKWELGFTTLVLFGGACFAAFPLFYATSFGGAYWVWLAILFCFIIQAISYEYRKKPDNFFGQKTYETFLRINGTLGTFLLGVAISTFFSGAEFYIDEDNFSHWATSLRGLDALLNPFNYLLGLALIFLVRITGAMYIINNIDHVQIDERARVSIRKDLLPFLLTFLGFLAWIFSKEGFAINTNGIVYMEKYKYLLNFLDMPFLGIAFILGVLLVLFAIFKILMTYSRSSIKIMGFGVVLSVTSLLMNVGLHGTSFYPSTQDLQSSLTIANASSSHYTLTVMSYVSLAVPFVLAYIAYVWKLMDKTPLTQDEVIKDPHGY